MSRRAAIYCRLSQDRTGAGVVVERQERECRELASRLGWEVSDVFADNDVSAYSNRPRQSYNRLLGDVRTGRVDAVIVWHMDRLTRRPAELEEWIALAERGRIEIATVTAGDIDLMTPTGRHYARGQANNSRYEVERIAERTKAGKGDAAKRGAWSGGQRIYGYSIVKAQHRQPDEPALRLVAHEADVVRDAARRVLAGESLRSIARGLNEAGGATTTGKPWTGPTLRKVLLRPATAGLRGSAGEVVARGDWEPLLDEDTWRGVVAVLTDPSRRTTDRYARTYLGSGLYRCGVCGGPLTGNTTAGGSSRRRAAAYRCRAADREGVSHVVRGVERLDAFITDVVVERLSRADALEASAPPPEDTAPLHAEAGALRARLDEVARGWAVGALTQAQLLAATNELRTRLEHVEIRIGQARRGSALDGLADTADVRAAWEAMGLDRRRAVLDLLIAVTVLPREHAGRLPGGAYFDPSAVRIDWKGGARPEESIGQEGLRP
jgi:site-specific DNA recombinase